MQLTFPFYLPLDFKIYFLSLKIRLMDTAREIIKESLPIKCLEAVIVGLYPLLTAVRLSLGNKIDNLLIIIIILIIKDRHSILNFNHFN